MKKKHPLVKIQENMIKTGIHWLSLVELRCALDGCRYGYEHFDEKPLDKCMYCGKRNPSLNDFWFDLSNKTKEGEE